MTRTCKKFELLRNEWRDPWPILKKIKAGFWERTGMEDANQTVCCLTL